MVAHNPVEKPYLRLLSEVACQEQVYMDRTGVGTRSVFGRQLRFDLREGFPLLTTKFVNFKAVVAELCWFLSGSTDTDDLESTIWDEWADENGQCGPIYGEQWRSWSVPFTEYQRRNGYNAPEPIDQIADLIKALKSKPHDRGHVVSAWNVADLPYMGLRPCHCLFQFYVRDNVLSCQLYQRSADIFIGVPFNIASYAMLTHMVAKQCGFEVGEFVHTFGDVHLYDNHNEQAALQLSRAPGQPPTFEWSGSDILNPDPKDFAVHGYKHHPAIKAPIAV